MSTPTPVASMSPQKSVLTVNARHFPSFLHRFYIEVIVSTGFAGFLHQLPGVGSPHPKKPRGTNPRSAVVVAADDVAGVGQ